MNRDMTLLRFMLLAAENVDTHTQSPASNFTKERAISYELITLGEAAKDLSADLKNSYPQIPWSLISGTRNRLAHDYEEISSKVIWDIVNTHLPVLVGDVRKILRTMEAK
jgi:uncharacterized protein with HEPN domain